MSTDYRSCHQPCDPLALSARGLRQLLQGVLLTLALALISQEPASAQQYRVVHCLAGCPEGAGPDNALIIRPIYALSYHRNLKTAQWVAYQVSAATVGIASSLSRAPRSDEYVEDTLQPEDFLQTGDSRLLRSQYVPLVNFAATPYWNDVNYLTNAVARSSSLSQGAWNGLEWAIRNAVNRQQELYVITGPVFDAGGEARRLDIATPHRVPDGFFKIVASSEGEVAAFLFRQDNPVGLHHCDLQSTVDEIETLTGLRFFPANNRPLRATLAAALNCRY